MAYATVAMCSQAAFVPFPATHSQFASNISPSSSIIILIKYLKLFVISLLLSFTLLVLGNNDGYCTFHVLVLIKNFVSSCHSPSYEELHMLTSLLECYILSGSNYLCVLYRFVGLQIYDPHSQRLFRRSIGLILLFHLLLRLHPQNYYFGHKL